MAQLHDTGEEFILKEAFGNGSGASSVSVGLFNYSADNLSDPDDVGDITTEPSGSGYERQDVSIGSGFSFARVGGDWQALLSDVVFDTDDSSEMIDGYFVTATFESEEAGDSSPQEHLLFSGELDQEYDLGSVTSFTLQGTGLSLS